MERVIDLDLEIHRVKLKLQKFNPDRNEDKKQHKKIIDKQK